MGRKLKQKFRRWRQQQFPVPRLSLSPPPTGAVRSQGSKAVVLPLLWVLSVLIAPQAEISPKGAAGARQGGKSWVCGTSFRTLSGPKLVCIHN